MTPMIDIVFLLITFFMTVTSYANAELVQVVMPIAPEAKVPEDVGDRQFISIAENGTYFLGAGSRPGHAPMPLQGVWTADQSALPPWKGDYHNDLNTQFTYAAYLTSNHLQQGEAFLDHLWKLLPAARSRRNSGSPVIR